MSKLLWDQIGERIAEAGVDRGVLYPFATTTFGSGVAWNGLTSVNEAPTGGEPSPFYADNRKYLELMSEEEYAGSIGCFTYPSEFQACLGEVELTPGMVVAQQTHKLFAFSYRTKIINDTNGLDYGYKIHIVYNALAGVASKDHTTMNESPELEELSFDFTTTKIDVTGGKPTSHLILDSTKVDSAKLAALELILYGNDGVEPRVPTPDEIAAIFISAAPSAIALSTIVPAANAPAVVISSDLVLTFNNKIAEESILLTTAAGVLVACTKTWDVAGKVLTIHPTANMAASTVHLVTIAGVADIYNQTLAPSVSKFTTAQYNTLKGLDI